MNIGKIMLIICFWLFGKIKYELGNDYEITPDHKRKFLRGTLKAKVFIK